MVLLPLLPPEDSMVADGTGTAEREKWTNIQMRPRVWLAVQIATLSTIGMAFVIMAICWVVNPPYSSAAEEVASARFRYERLAERLAVEEFGSEGAAPTPPISPPPLPLAASNERLAVQESSSEGAAPPPPPSLPPPSLPPPRKGNCWVCRTLWKTAGASSKQPRALPPADWPAVASCGVVVAYCDSDLAWLTHYVHQLATLTRVVPTVTIYSKCGKESTARALFDASDSLNASVISLPNTGRNDHTYAHHVRTHYHSLQDVMIFIKDTYNPNHRQTGLWRLFDNVRAVESVYGEVVSLGFACLYSTDGKENKHGRVHMRSVWHNWDILRGSHSARYKGSGADFQSAVRPLGRWFDRIRSDIVEPIEPPGKLWPVCYGGNFGATRERIQAVPEALWERIRLALTRADNIEEGHFLERIWAGLLNPRLSPQDETLLLDHRVDNFNVFRGAGHMNLCDCATRTLDGKNNTEPPP